MAKDMTLLWASESPPCWRTMIMLEEKQLQGCNKKRLYFQKMEHKSQEVLDINPRGQLPSFKHGNLIVNDSYATCFYLESQFKNQGTKLIPEDTAQQALMYQRMFEGVTFYDKVDTELVTLVLVGFIGSVIYYEYYVAEEERHDSAVKRNTEALVTELKLWEGYLQKLGSGSYLAGPSFTLADVVVFPTVESLFRYGLSAQRYPKLGEYYALVKDRPSVKASWPAHLLENPTGNEVEDVEKLKDV